MDEKNIADCEAKIEDYKAEIEFHKSAIATLERGIAINQLLVDQEKSRKQGD
jgi:hypothetical protein